MHGKVDFKIKKRKYQLMENKFYEKKYCWTGD